MSADAEPNHLLLDGPFTNAGLAGLAGLDGLFGLSFFWHITALTGSGLETPGGPAQPRFPRVPGTACATTRRCVTSARSLACGC